MREGTDCLQPHSLGNPEEHFLAKRTESTESGQVTVARNAFYLTLGQVITTVLSILFGAALGRTLGAGEFGLYFLMTSFAAFAYVLADWGQGLYIVREVARRPECGSTFLGTALLLRTACAVLVSIPTGLAVWALGYDAVTRLYSIVFIGVSLPFFLAQTYGMAFRAQDRMGLDAGVSVANKFTLLGLALAALALGGGLPGVLAAQALSGFLALAMARLLYRRMKAGPVRYSSQIARAILIGGSAFVTFGVANNIQPYIDAVILSKLAPADAVGWYGAAKTIIGTVFAPALILGAASLPSLARAAANGDAFKAEVRSALRPILWLGAVAAIGTYLFADGAIAIVYGQQQFAPSVTILQVYAPAFLPLFMNVLFGTALSSMGRARPYAVLRVSSVVVSTVLELVLIPVFQQRTGNGGIGVATAFVASEFMILAGSTILLWRKGLGPDLFVDAARTLGSGALTLLFFSRMPPLPFVVGVPICVTVFLLCSAGLGLVRVSDLQTLRMLLRKRRSESKSGGAVIVTDQAN